MSIVKASRTARNPAGAFVLVGPDAAFSPAPPHPQRAGGLGDGHGGPPPSPISPCPFVNPLPMSLPPPSHWPGGQEGLSGPGSPGPGVHCLLRGAVGSSCVAGLTGSGREVSVTAERGSNHRARTRSPGGGASSREPTWHMNTEVGAGGRRVRDGRIEQPGSGGGPPGPTLDSPEVRLTQVQVPPNHHRLGNFPGCTCSSRRGVGGL